MRIHCQWIRLLLLCGIGLSFPMLLAQDRAREQRDSEQLEKAFIERLTNSVLVGQFSVEGRNPSAHEERYEIRTIRKVMGHEWMITARIKYGDKDITLPVLVHVFWADDTPVISLTNRTIPGLGTFTARVMIHGSRYAGSWQHDEVGGLMWGRIERLKHD